MALLSSLLLVLLDVDSGIGTEAFAAIVDDDDAAVSFAALFAAALPFCGRVVVVVFCFVVESAAEAVPSFSSFGVSVSVSLSLSFVESSSPPPPLVFVFVLAILGKFLQWNLSS